MSKKRANLLLFVTAILIAFFFAWQEYSYTEEIEEYTIVLKGEIVKPFKIKSIDSEGIRLTSENERLPFGKVEFECWGRFSDDKTQFVLFWSKDIGLNEKYKGDFFRFDEITNIFTDGEYNYENDIGFDSLRQLVISETLNRSVVNCNLKVKFHAICSEYYIPDMESGFTDHLFQKFSYPENEKFNVTKYYNYIRFSYSNHVALEDMIRNNVVSSKDSVIIRVNNGYHRKRVIGDPLVKELLDLSFLEKDAEYR